MLDGAVHNFDVAESETEQLKLFRNVDLLESILSVEFSDGGSALIRGTEISSLTLEPNE